MYYVIMKGSYSDRHIVAVTCDQEKANKIKECYSDLWNEADIEEWQESDICFNNYYTINYDAIDNTYSVEKQSPEFIEYNMNSICEYYNRDGFSVNIQAENEDVALKIARDLYAEYKAKNEGIV